MIVCLDLVSSAFWVVNAIRLYRGSGIGVGHRILRMERGRKGTKGYMLDDAAREGRIFESCADPC